jgi:uncharacterized membrane protein YhhN
MFLISHYVYVSESFVKQNFSGAVENLVNVFIVVARLVLGAFVSKFSDCF